jgi:hypothetical protein
MQLPEILRLGHPLQDDMVRKRAVEMHWKEKDTPIFHTHAFTFGRHLIPHLKDMSSVTCMSIVVAESERWCTNRACPAVDNLVKFLRQYEAFREARSLDLHYGVRVAFVNHVPRACLDNIFESPERIVQMTQEQWDACVEEIKVKSGWQDVLRRADI